MNGRVNVSVANVYTDAAYQSEVISQAILGEKIEVRETDNNFSLVHMPDGYTGWISNYQWVNHKKIAGDPVRIRSHFAWVYVQPDASSGRIRDLVIGATLVKTAEKEDWFQVSLPDGILGWVEKKSFAPFPQESRQGVVDLAQEFLGYPYHWGGRSPKGFDCSGLIQTIFAHTGVSLPRDSWMQHRDAQPVSDDPLQAEPGDLCFFAEGGKRITHVGVAVGEGRIIHARGFVRQNSLKESDPDFDRDLARTFVDVKTYL